MTSFPRVYLVYTRPKVWCILYKIFDFNPRVYLVYTRPLVWCILYKIFDFNSRDGKVKDFTPRNSQAPSTEVKSNILLRWVRSGVQGPPGLVKSLILLRRHRTCALEVKSLTLLAREGPMEETLLSFGLVDNRGVIRVIKIKDKLFRTKA
jgi:hypothetical protein